MKLTIILAAAIIAAGLSKWLNRATTYHTPTAVYPMITAHAQDMLFGHCRNGGVYTT